MTSFSQEQLHEILSRPNYTLGHAAVYAAPAVSPMTIQETRKPRSDKGKKRPRDKANCKQCGAEFFAPKSQKRKYCSPKCAYASKDRVVIRKKDRGTRICRNCKKEFALHTKAPNANYCCHKCALEYLRPLLNQLAKTRVRPPAKTRVEKECPTCRCKFTSWKSAERIFCSNKCSVPHTTIAGNKTRHEQGFYRSQKPYTRGNARWVEAGGKRFYARSSWEGNYGLYLQFQKEAGLISDWEHEPHTFWFTGIKRGVMSYLPDFRVTENDGRTVWHEVKGWMDAKSQTKIKRMAKYYPSERLVLIDKTRYKGIEKTTKHLIKGWV